MFQSLLQWDILQKIVLNTLLVSIPEELFLVMFTLILLGEFDYWKEDECKKLINRWDYGRILIPTIVAATISNILRYMFVDIDISSPVTIFTLLVLIVATNDIFGDASAMKWVGKAFAFLMLACVIVGITEALYIPFILYGTGKTLEEINNNIFLNLLVSLPSRIMLSSILLYFISQKRTLLKGKVLKCIISNSIVLTITSIVSLFNVIFFIVAFKIINYDRALLNMRLSMQILIIVGVILFPILNISGLLWNVYCIKNKEINDKKIASDKLSILLNEIKIYTEKENYDNIKWKLNEIGMGIEEVVTDLYKDIETGKKKNKC